MAARSIASLSLSFGLVSIPIKLYSATESSAAMRFKLMAASGARVRQQYVTDTDEESHAIVEKRASQRPAPEPERLESRSRGSASKVADFRSSQETVAPPPYELPAPITESVVARSTMLKGYEFEKGKFVLFTPEELKALEMGSRQTIDIVSFIPENAVDPIYYIKAYLLAPDKRGSRPYNLLLRAMRDTGRCALAKWAFRSKEYVVQIRPTESCMVLQQLFYAEEVRSIADLHIEPTDIGDIELKLAKQLIEQISQDSYDPTAFVDEEKKRILAAVEAKVAGKRIVAPAQAVTTDGHVINLVEALRASLRSKPSMRGSAPPSMLSTCERKPAKRAPRKTPAIVTSTPKGRSGGR
ncbi:MAG: Ku protein [Pseudomonadota bacterium]|nr:Ku protein [Pseudomonadota bacterium]